jgi:hypothetical protein
MRKLRNVGLWASVGATVLTTLLVAAPATAKTKLVTDGRDRPANADIRSVTYRDGELRAGATVRVRDLQPKGRLVALIGAPDSDLFYEATVWPRGDGTVGTRLVLVTTGSRMPRSCPTMTATWSPDADTVEVSVPQTCLDFDAFLERHFMKVTFSGAGSQDAARGVEVGRGSSPGCATAREMRALHRGEPRARVQALLDTDGRFGDGAAGGYSRIYRSCSGGKPWFVGYEGATNTLVDKGRVR